MSSKLLLTGDYPLIASPTLAQAYGMAAATFLQKLHYCLQSTDAKPHKGKKYWFHTYTQWVDTLGIFSISTIKRIVTKLKDEGILIVKKLSQSKWLQTNYYTINYKKLTQLFTPQLDHQDQDQPSQKPKIDLKVAAEALPRPVVNHPKHSAKGTEKPLNSIIPEDIIPHLPQHVFSTYKALLNVKVDLAYDDPRINQWSKHITHITRYIAAYRESLGGIEKSRWHTPEQLKLDRFS